MAPEPKKTRKKSSYNYFRRYLSTKGLRLSKADTSQAWSIAKKTVDDGLHSRGSFEQMLNSSIEHVGKDGKFYTTDDVIQQMSKKDAEGGYVFEFEKEFSDELNRFWKRSGRAEQAQQEIRDGTYRTESGASARVPTGKTAPIGDPGGLPKTMFDPMIEKITSAASTAASSTTGSGPMGQQNPMTGQYMKVGATRNAGGGNVNTQVGEGEGGDVITQGARSTEVAKQTLRPKIPIAGTESIRTTHADNLQSDTVFETFSAVPKGNGLGPYNKLNRLNEAHDFLRFGVGPLAMPRTDDPSNTPHPDPIQWIENKPPEIVDFEAKQESMDISEEMQAADHEMKRPESTIIDGDDFNTEPSSKALPRHFAPTPFTTVYNNRRVFLPASEPAGIFKNNVPFRSADGRSAWRGAI